MSTSKNDKKTVAAEEKATKKKPAVKKAAPKKAVKSKEVAAPKREFNEKATFAYGVIRQPVFTEKSAKDAESGKYTFYVETSANKTQVAQAVKTLYGVTPVSVNMIAVKGKKIRSGRVMGARKNRKKAIVTLKKGDAITIME